MNNVTIEEDFEFVFEVTKAIFGLGGFVFDRETPYTLPKNFDDLVSMIHEWRYIYELLFFYFYLFYF